MSDTTQRMEAYPPPYRCPECYCYNGVHLPECPQCPECNGDGAGGSLGIGGRCPKCHGSGKRR